MRENAAFGPAPGAGRIHNARGVLALPGHKNGIALAAKLFPSKPAFEVGGGRRFGDQHDANFVVFKIRVLGDSAPEVVFDN
jgi:hypothetical protein